MNTNENVIKHGPHAGHILRGNYKISTDRKGRMVAHKWWPMAGRWVRCGVSEAMIAGAA